MNIAAIWIYIPNIPFSELLNSMKGLVNYVFVINNGNACSTDIYNIINLCQSQDITINIHNSTETYITDQLNNILPIVDEYRQITYTLLLHNVEKISNARVLYDVLHQHIETNVSGISTDDTVEQKQMHGNTIRVIKNRTGWYYRGRVYERITNKDLQIETMNITGVTFHCVNKDMPDYETQKKILHIDLLQDPTDMQTMFVLAQLYELTQEYQSAYYLYEQIHKIDTQNYRLFYSRYKCGLISNFNKFDWNVCAGWFLSAFEASERVEPLIQLCEYYKDKNNLLYYTYANLACKLHPPTDQHLPYNTEMYEITRWDMQNDALNKLSG